MEVGSAEIAGSIGITTLTTLAAEAHLQNMNHPLIFIVTAPLVDLLRQENLPLPELPIRFYPDGSMRTDDHRVLCTVNRGVLESAKAMIGCGGSKFRPLAAFGGDSDAAPFFDISYPGTCDWMGEDENWALTYPGVFKKPTQNEYDLAHVNVLVRLRRKFAQAIAEELAGVIRQWLAKIGSKGVFGEAGVKLASPAMRYLGRDAGFHLDARGSGQETLNTLYLAVLNWGIAQRRPLSLTDLAADPSESVFSANSMIPLT